MSLSGYVWIKCFVCGVVEGLGWMEFEECAPWLFGSNMLLYTSRSVRYFCGVSNLSYMDSTNSQHFITSSLPLYSLPSTPSLLPSPSPLPFPPLLPSPPHQSIKQLAHSLSAEHCLDSSSLVTIYWPQDRCPLLKEDVVLVDRCVFVCVVCV